MHKHFNLIFVQKKKIKPELGVTPPPLSQIIFSIMAAMSSPLPPPSPIKCLFPIRAPGLLPFPASHIICYFLSLAQMQKIKTNLKETAEYIRTHTDNISGSNTLLLLWAINFCENHAVLPNTYSTHHWQPFVLNPFFTSTKAAFHSQMKFLSNSCQWEGNEASAFISPRGIAGLSLELMMQCLFTVELPLNKKGRKRFLLYRLHPPCTSHLLYRSCLEKQHSLFNIYAQRKAPPRLVQHESSRNTTKTAQITVKMNCKSSCGPQKESHHIWDFHKVQVPRLVPNHSPACSKEVLSSTANELLWDEAERKFHKQRKPQNPEAHFLRILASRQMRGFPKLLR